MNAHRVASDFDEVALLASLHLVAYSMKLTAIYLCFFQLIQEVNASRLLVAYSVEVLLENHARRVASDFDEVALLASLHLVAYSMKLTACSTN
ncbi:hypothetical protein CIL05_17585 [Virgibacillus profundi]|uniref:Uncharacterized protein n=1 Tax=Virgibacillus profundi TaxID=2024555 RepID=A0A2A2I9D1_9BACI|nr:hypothetical protein [Virgibacillus profundi]PAV28182.1 hypothetical protein CIL05_17585 [Virgibacillus profundi]PXY52487.1 hypothetical protein CIT14_17020 [Virgibacillus profundi]